MSARLPMPAYSAMSEQLDRVNRQRQRPPHDPQIAELEQAISRLERRLEQERKYARELEDKLAARSSGRLMLRDRPTFTTAEVAKITGLSISQVNRYLNDGHWQGELQANRRWLVYADQPFNRRKPGKRRK